MMKVRHLVGTAAVVVALAAPWASSVAFAQESPTPQPETATSTTQDDNEVPWGLLGLLGLAGLAGARRQPQTRSVEQPAASPRA